MGFLLLMYTKGPETANEKHQSQGLRWNLGCANRPKKSPCYLSPLSIREQGVSSPGTKHWS